MKKLFLILSILLATCTLFASKVIIPEADGNFENGLNAWAPAVINGHTVTLDNTGKLTGANSARLTVASIPTNSADLQLNYFFSAFKGAKYKLRFKVVASGDANLVVGLTQDRAPFTAVLLQTIAVSTTIKTVEFVSDVITFSDGMFKLCFYGGDAAAGSSIWIDDVRLLDVTNSTQDNVAVNGDFEENPMNHSYGLDNDGNDIIGITPGWKTVNWVNGEHSIYEGTSAISGNRSYCVTRDIGNASNPNLSELSTIFYAHPGEQFNVSFDINADIPFYGDIHTGPIYTVDGTMPIGGYKNAVIKVNAGDLIMSGTNHWTNNTSVVTTTNKGYYWFVFQFGWIDIPVGPTNKITFLIDNVKIERTTPYATVYSDMDTTTTGLMTQKEKQDRIYVVSDRKLKIVMNQEREYVLSLYNVCGVKAYEVQVNGSTTISLPESIRQGVFVAKLSNNNKVSTSTKLIIK